MFPEHKLLTSEARRRKAKVLVEAACLRVPSRDLFTKKDILQHLINANTPSATINLLGKLRRKRSSLLKLLRLISKTENHKVLIRTATIGVGERSLNSDEIRPQMVIPACKKKLSFQTILPNYVPTIWKLPSNIKLTFNTIDHYLMATFKSQFM